MVMVAMIIAQITVKTVGTVKKLIIMISVKGKEVKLRGPKNEATL